MARVKTPPELQPIRESLRVRRSYRGPAIFIIGVNNLLPARPGNMTHKEVEEG
ncbi:MAG: hypothetical protein R6U13_04665 [Desulfatiglandaceae bacterium]